MKYYSFQEPAPQWGYDASVTTTVSEQGILETYYPTWAGRMASLSRGELITYETCIEDFIVANWAYETDRNGQHHLK
jgi:hypothetical protein